MADGSKIEWTQATWNPVTGCSKVSPGCQHCYAERLAKRLQAMGMSRYRNGFGVTLQPDALQLPERWRQPRLVFVNSMSDLFHERVPTDYISRVFAVMNRCERHTFQVLTKRSQRLREVCRLFDWRANIWMGVSVESANYLHRIVDLKATPAAVKFLSLEPLLGPLDNLPLDGIDWVIVGGESGPGARPMEQAWVESVQAQCIRAEVPFFFKQWGGAVKTRTGRLLNGNTYDDMPHVRSSDLTDGAVAAD